MPESRRANISSPSERSLVHDNPRESAARGLVKSGSCQRPGKDNPPLQAAARCSIPLLEAFRTLGVACRRRERSRPPPSRASSVRPSLGVDRLARWASEGPPRPMADLLSRLRPEILDLVVDHSSTVPGSRFFYSAPNQSWPPAGTTADAFHTASTPAPPRRSDWAQR